MKRIKPFFLLGICFLAIFSLLDCSAQKTKTSKILKPDAATVVYVVRHAEKASQSTTMMSDDPALSEAGQKQAEVLKTNLASVPVAALFATKFQRTQQTLQPLAQAKGLTVQIYNASDFQALAQTIKENHANKVVVVAGHSNTLLPIIEALGGKKPVAEIIDYQYDYLFKVTLRDGKEAEVEVQHYGAPSVVPVK